MDDMDFYNNTTLNVQKKGQATGVHALNEYEKVVYLIVELDAIANMEGLSGFYSILVGEAESTVDALEKIGTLESADLIRRANSLFPGGSPPKDPALLHNILNNLDDSVLQEINQIGDQFLDRPDGLEEKLRAFILVNKEQFME
jgi:hypothetical protein